MTPDNSTPEQPSPTPESSAADTEAAEQPQSELTERGREVWLAGLGALATVEEEGTKLFKRLVDRGQEFEDKRRHTLEEATEKVRERSDEALSQLEDAGEETQSMLSSSIKTALERFGVPTRNEVDDLASKVDHLSQQVEALAESLSDESPSDEDA
jgi:poly(hydroxyalkanoate) granule-associated protein